jgi:hypoxanthine phosphoribosyltransferase
MKSDLKNILISEESIRERVHEMGRIISSDYKDRNPVFIGILKGALTFMADLIREIPLKLKYDFIAISSYGASTRSSGTVRIQKDLDYDIKGEHVLIVEDIVDTGLTLHFLLENLRVRNPKSIKICTLLDKPMKRRILIRPDYNGFEIPDVFVVGYGLDYNENYRNLPYIGILKEAMLEASDSRSG